MNWIHSLLRYFLLQTPALSILQKGEYLHNGIFNSWFHESGNTNFASVTFARFSAINAIIPSIHQFEDDSKFICSLDMHEQKGIESIIRASDEDVMLLIMKRSAVRKNMQ